MRETLVVKTRQREELVDITEQVQSFVDASGIRNGLVAAYVQGATAGIMIQENWGSQPGKISFYASLMVPKQNDGWSARLFPTRAEHHADAQR